MAAESLFLSARHHPSAPHGPIARALRMHISLHRTGPPDGDMLHSSRGQEQGFVDLGLLPTTTTGLVEPTLLHVIVAMLQNLHGKNQRVGYARLR